MTPPCAYSVSTTCSTACLRDADVSAEMAIRARSIQDAYIFGFALQETTRHDEEFLFGLDLIHEGRDAPRGRPPPAPMSIRAARPDDLALMVEIERAAGETFRSLGMDLVADDDPGSVAELAPYADAGRAFVSVGADDRPTGYVVLDVVDGAAHVEQVSVHPDHARQGIGRALLERAAAWARAHGLRAITLTTYVEVEWNGPYYERLGFRYLTPEEETPGLRAIRRHERALGLDAWPRACMARTLD